ncbi:MAG: hypothetical protein WA888_10105 [Burkholderiaceae bacterium]
MNTAAWLPVLHGASGDSPDEVDTIVSAQAISAALCDLGWRSDLVFLGADLAAVDSLKNGAAALVFNLVEAIEDDSSQAWRAPAALAKVELAFTGAGEQAQWLCRSKTAVKQRLRDAGLPTPDWSDGAQVMPTANQVIVKSDREHASVGLSAASVVPAADASREIARCNRAFSHPFFAEAFVDGREFNLSVLPADGTLHVLPAAEIDFIDYPPGSVRIVDYAAKWEPNSHAYQNTPRRFEFTAADRMLIAELESLALATCQVLQVNTYARVDFRVDQQGRPYILEINLNPCIAPDAGFTAAALRAGLSYSEMLSQIIKAAHPGLGPPNRPQGQIKNYVAH